MAWELSSNRPTPAPLPGGEPATVAWNEAPLPRRGTGVGSWFQCMVEKLWWLSLNRRFVAADVRRRIMGAQFSVRLLTSAATRFCGMLCARLGTADSTPCASLMGFAHNSEMRQRIRLIETLCLFMLPANRGRAPRPRGGSTNK